RITEYAYTADGQLERLTLVNDVTGNQVTRWVYGTTLDDSEIARADLLRAKIYPMSDDDPSPLGNGYDETWQRIEYTYNRQGQPLSMIDPNQTEHQYTYDDLGRIVQDQIPTFGDGIDQSVKRIGTGYTTRGLVEKVTSYDFLSAGSGSIVNEVGYVYDDFGQLEKDSQSHSGAVTGATPAVSYAYADGSSGNTARRLSTTYPDGRQLDLSYGTSGGENDILSRIESLKINGESQPAATYTYVGLARYIQISYPEPGVALTYLKPDGAPVGDAGDPYTGYDRFGRTVEMRWQTTGVETPELRDGCQWGYDRSSNRTWRKNLLEDVSGQDEHYDYDALHQVTDCDRGDLNINRTAIGGIPQGEQTFAYDPTGNWDRTTIAVDGTETLDQTRVNNQDNQLTQLDGSNTGILYDRAGNALQMPPDKTGDWSKYYQLTWDGWNRLVKVSDQIAATVATYAYDGNTRRTTSTKDGTTTHYYYNDLWRPVEEREDAATTAHQQYVWGARPGHRDELVLRDRDTDGNGTLDQRLYCLMDYFNPTAVIDTAGNVQERYRYTAFGLRTVMDEDWAPIPVSAFDFDFGFHGQFLDTETGYYNYGYRYYSPEIGRWLSRDPIEEKGGDSLYLFVGNSPIAFNDILGLSKICDDLHNACWRKCWNKKPSWPCQCKGDDCHYRQCEAKCLIVYLACEAEEALDKVIEACRQRPGLCVSAGIVGIIGGVVSVVEPTPVVELLTLAAVAAILGVPLDFSWNPVPPILGPTASTACCLNESTA
ncbi:MAG: hypothetical protein KC587_09345, partial [Nitrospira sp.]|nr:hypothetical protein [Nitrospira sp.]